MQRFCGRLRDGDRVIYDRVTGFLEDEGGDGSGCDVGRFEIHQGGILGGDLATDRSYILDLGDGRAGPIRLTKVHASNSAGIATMEFRPEGEWAANAVVTLA